jgi:hypothetical protein
MQKVAIAGLAFAAGLIVGGGSAWSYVDEEYAQHYRVQMTLHGTNQAVACQQPSELRPKNLDCRGIAP